MILCLDAGNTRLKWGLRAGNAWRAQGVLDHAEIPRLPALLPEAPFRILACNVAGAAGAARIEELAATLAVPLDWFRSSTSAGGVRNHYDVPEQLGADRWAALVGARSRHGGAALVVMCGTATTVDRLDADGTFRGGLILPGLTLMRNALARHAADLPEARGTYRDIPTNTDDAIVSGVLHATLGAIERMAHPVMGDGFAIVLSGGAADQIAPHLRLPLLRVDALVLEGLASTLASHAGAP